MRILNVFFVFVFCFFVIESLRAQVPASVSFKLISGKTITTEKLLENDLTVLFFLMPECPLCENYTLNIKKVQEYSKGRLMGVWGVFSGDAYSKSEISSYLKKFNMGLPSILDVDKVLSSGLGATVTPEVFVLNKQGVVLYSGKIDNWLEKLGHKRPVVTEFYLDDAIRSVLSGGLPAVRRTEPVGCFIE
jgi:hypothetical protein